MSTNPWLADESSESRSQRPGHLEWEGADRACRPLSAVRALFTPLISVWSPLLSPLLMAFYYRPCGRQADQQGKALHDG
jgi:hypothetical protein